MDIYGIGAAALGAYRAVLCALQGSGRTTYLLKCVKDGDTVVFRNEREAHYFKRLAQRSGLTHLNYQVSPVYLDSVSQARGNLHFDHSWVEEYYERALKRAAEDLKMTVDRLSRKPSSESREAAAMASRFAAFPPIWED